MRKSRNLRQKSRLNVSTWMAPAIIGLALYLGFPSVAAYAGALPLEQHPTVPMPLAAPEPAPVTELEIQVESAQVSLERRRSEIEALSRHDPQRTAELLRTLLSERVGA